MHETVCTCILSWLCCFLLLRLKCDWLEASSYAEQLYLHSRWSKVFVITRNSKHADIIDGIGSISHSANLLLDAIHSFRAEFKTCLSVVQQMIHVDICGTQKKSRGRY